MLQDQAAAHDVPEPGRRPPQPGACLPGPTNAKWWDYPEGVL